MSEQHTPEPWYVIEKPAPSHVDHGHRMMALCGRWMVAAPYHVAFGQWDNEANAKRIVACVNACAGYKTDELEQIGRWITSGESAEVAQLNERCDELLAALKALRAAVSITPTMQDRSYIDLGIQVNAAITRATESAPPVSPVALASPRAAAEIEQAGADPWSAVLREFADYCEGHGFETVNVASIREHADMLDNSKGDRP